MDKISPYISYTEATESQTARAKGIENKPTLEQIRAMKLVARMCFDPVREFLNAPIRVNSFFRSEELNKATGGSTTSQHCKGEAIDMDALGGHTNKEIFDFIRDRLTFDQLIWEFGTDQNPDWVHVSYSAKQNRNQVLKSIREGGKTKYVKL